MEISLKGRVALVTGGSRGIGKAIALSLAAAGADVAINYRREEEAAQQTVAEIEKLGRKAKAYRAPVDDFEAVALMVEEVVHDFGSLSILINNAGIASRGQTVADTNPAELERVIRVHALAPRLPVRPRPAPYAQAAARRHHHDFLGGHAASRRQWRALQYGQGGDGSPRPDTGQGRAPPRHPHQYRCTEPDRDRDGHPPDQGAHRRQGYSRAGCQFPLPAGSVCRRMWPRP